MKKLLAALATIALVPTLAHADALPPGVDREGTATAAAAYNWTGATATAANVSGFVASNKATCDKTPRNYCDYTLVRFDLPFPADFARPHEDPDDPSSPLADVATITQGATVTIDTFSNRATDYDLRLYESNAQGAKGATGDALFSGQDAIAEAQKGASGQPFDRPETVYAPVTSVRTYHADGTYTDATSSYYLVEVVYFQSVNSSYRGHAVLDAA